MNRKTICALSAVPIALAVSGCSNFTEYSELPSAGFFVIAQESLELLGTIPGVEGARALCAAGDKGLFFVSSGTGELHRLNSETMARDTVFTVGPGSGSGYGSMAYVGWKNSLYLVGALGNILEINAATGEIMDDIGSIPAPATITPSKDGLHLFVSSPMQKRVYGLNTRSNAIQWNWIYDLTPTVTGINTGFPDTLLVATNDASGKAYVQPCSASPGRLVPLPRSSDIERSDWLGCMFAAHPGRDDSFGTVSVIDSLFPALSILGTVTVPGNPVCLEASRNRTILFILSAARSGGCTLYSCKPDWFSLVDSLELPGAPAGMVTTGDRLVVMSY